MTIYRFLAAARAFSNMLSSAARSKKFPFTTTAWMLRMFLMSSRYRKTSSAKTKKLAQETSQPEIHIFFTLVGTKDWYSQ
jgi:hypothetical protein